MLQAMLGPLTEATWQTLYMTFISGFIAVIAGIPLGVLLFVTRHKDFFPGVVMHRALAMVVDAVRSVPFIILMVAITPLTHFIVGTSIGTWAAIVPLSLAAIPFYARIVEGALAEVPSGLIEAANSMGARPRQIIVRVLLAESKPALVRGVTLLLIALVGYSAMAGAIGGGGLGDLAIRYGYQRFQGDVMLATVIVLIVLVQALQWCGDQVAKHLSQHL